MRAKIERWQGALAHVWVGLWAASATNEWWIPRPADATPPSAQFRRIPLGPKFFRPDRRRVAGQMQPHRAARRFSSETKKPQVSRSTRVLQRPARCHDVALLATLAKEIAPFASSIRI